MKLLKTRLRNQLKQISLLFISTESPKEGFDDIVFEDFVDELKHRNPDIGVDL